MYKAATKAVNHVRCGKGPYFLELMTYRYRGHSMSDSNAYRAKTEERMWSKRDPVIMLRDRLIEAGKLTLQDYKDMDTGILDEIENRGHPRSPWNSPEPAYGRTWRTMCWPKMIRGSRAGCTDGRHDVLGGDTPRPGRRTGQ